MSAKSQIAESTDAVRMLRPAAVSVALGAIVCVVFLLLMSVIVSSASVPQSIIDPMATFSMSVGAFAAGLCCARIIHRNGLMCGLVCGVIFSAVVLVCGFAIPGNGLGLGALIKVMFMLLSSMLGGVLGVNTKKHRRK